VCFTFAIRKKNEKFKRKKAKEEIQSWQFTRAITSTILYHHLSPLFRWKINSPLFSMAEITVSNYETTIDRNQKIEHEKQNPTGKYEH